MAYQRYNCSRGALWKMAELLPGLINPARVWACNIELAQRFGVDAEAVWVFFMTMLKASDPEFLDGRYQLDPDLQKLGYVAWHGWNLQRFKNLDLHDQKILLDR